MPLHHQFYHVWLVMSIQTLFCYNFETQTKLYTQGSGDKTVRAVYNTVCHESYFNCKGWSLAHGAGIFFYIHVRCCCIQLFGDYLSWSNALEYDAHGRRGVGDALFIEYKNATERTACTLSARLFDDHCY